MTTIKNIKQMCYNLTKTTRQRPSIYETRGVVLNHHTIIKMHDIPNTNTDFRKY